MVECIGSHETRALPQLEAAEQTCAAYLPFANRVKLQA